MVGLDKYIEWVYSSGDLMLANIKLILMFMFLQFALTGISIIRDGMKASR